MSGVTTGPQSGGERDVSDGPDEHPPTDPNADDQPLRLTVSAVARRLGVAPATLRTWDRRYGIGPTDRTSGRHRRYGPDDIARLEQMQRALLRGASPAEAARYARSSVAPLHAAPRPEGALTSPAGAETAGPVLVSGVLPERVQDEPDVDIATNTGGGGLKLAGAGPRARGLGRAALALDSAAAQRLLSESIEADGVVTTWCNVLQPVLRAIADRRQRTGSGIEVQQLLVDSATTSLRGVLAHAPPAVSPRPVLLCSAPGEARDLELIALAAALAANRVGQRLFAPPLPKEGLDRAVRQLGPAAVVVWAEQPHYAAARLVGDLPQGRQRVRVFVAGPGWDAAELPAAVEALESLEAAVERLTADTLSEM